MAEVTIAFAAPVEGIALRYWRDEAVRVVCPSTSSSNADARSAATSFVEIPGTEDRAASSVGLVAIAVAWASKADCTLGIARTEGIALYKAEVSKALDDCPETTAMVDESRKPTARLESMIALFKGVCFGRKWTVNDTSRSDREVSR